MPVEIKELVIRIVVDSSSAAGGNASPVELPDYQQLVRDCVEQVLRILKREQER